MRACANGAVAGGRSVGQGNAMRDRSFVGDWNGSTRPVMLRTKMVAMINQMVKGKAWPKIVAGGGPPGSLVFRISILRSALLWPRFSTLRSEEASRNHLEFHAVKKVS